MSTRQHWLSSVEIDDNFLLVSVVALYFVGLIFHTYPAFVWVTGGHRIFRLDWALSVPLLIYIGYMKYSIIVGRSVVLAIAFITLAAVTAFINGMPFPTQFLTIFLQLFYAIGLFVAFVSLQPDADQLRALLRVWTLLITLTAVYAIYQAVAFHFSFPFADPYAINPAGFNNGFGKGGYARPAAVFKEPAWFASFLVSGISVLVPCVAARRPILYSRQVQAGALVSMILALLLTASLSAYLTLGIGSFLFFILPQTRRFTTKILLFIIPVALFAVIGSLIFDVMLVSSALDRLELGLRVLTQAVKPGGSSIHVRYARYLATIEAWEQNPIFGVGLGQYPGWVSDQSLASIREILTVNKSLRAIHGVWFQVLAGTGAVGLVTFIIFLVFVLRKEISILIRVDGVRYILVTAVILLTAIQLIGWSFNYSLVYPFKWIQIGLGLGFILQLDV